MYIRALLGFVITLALMLIIMPFFINYLKKSNLSQAVSEYALEEYKKKAKTPIMGGLLFVIIPLFSFILMDTDGLVDGDCALIILAYTLFCLVGFLDDYLILRQHNNKGLSPIIKLIMEAVFVLLIYFMYPEYFPINIDIPFINGGLIIGVLSIPFALLMYLGEANAVNFTDGMDGLCAGVSAISLIGFMVICAYYNVSHVFIFLACVLGGLIGYLRFNFHPAKIFMGDSGSLALGALFASLALVLQKEISLIFIGGVFLCEMMCVLIQQISVRLFHKRVFSYTPIHYAFVIKGHDEVTVVKRFYYVTILLTIIGTILGIL